MKKLLALMAAFGLMSAVAMAGHGHDDASGEAAAKPHAAKKAHHPVTKKGHGKMDKMEKSDHKTTTTETTTETKHEEVPAAH